jgi:hypothetical protein
MSIVYGISLFEFIDFFLSSPLEDLPSSPIIRRASLFIDFYFLFFEILCDRYQSLSSRALRAFIFD